MYHKVSVVLFLLISSCAGPLAIQKPEGIPACRSASGYSGYAGGQTEIKNIVSGTINAHHVGDLMYKMMGPMAEAMMVIFTATLKSIGTTPITIDISSFKIQGDAGAIILAIPPNKILELSRGANIASTNIFETMGEAIITGKFSESIDIKPEEEGLIMIAFPLPLPNNPKIILSVANSSDEIPICWHY